MMGGRNVIGLLGLLAVLVMLPGPPVLTMAAAEDVVAASSDSAASASSAGSPAAAPITVTSYADAQAMAAARVQAAQAQTQAAAAAAAPAVSLPACPANSGVLLAAPAGLFPRDWDALQPQAQAFHPINLAMMQLASVANADAASQFSNCLARWGVAPASIKLLNASVKGYAAQSNAAVMHNQADVFITFRGTDDDHLVNIDCALTAPLATEFPGQLTKPDVRLHRGFWAAYSALHAPLFAAVQGAVDSIKAVKGPGFAPRIFVVGHSLGGALANIAALKLHTSPAFKGMVGGVWTFGAPRVGNPAWQDSYHGYLLPATLRMHHAHDWAAALPTTRQVCLNGLVLGTYAYGHVGRAMQLCWADRTQGLQGARLFAAGTDAQCEVSELLYFDAHFMAAYWDGWLRAWYTGNNQSLAILQHPVLAAVRCGACVSPLGRGLLSMPDNRPVRDTALVTCISNGSCNLLSSFRVVTTQGPNTTLVPFNAARTCDASLACTPA